MRKTEAIAVLGAPGSRFPYLGRLTQPHNIS
jgi:hypothetical protein